MGNEAIPLLVQVLSENKASASVNLPTVITTLFAVLTGGGFLKAATIIYNRKGELRKINVNADSISVENAAKVLEMVQKQLKQTQDDYDELRREAKEEAAALKTEIKALKLEIKRLEKKIDDQNIKLETLKGKMRNGV